MKFYSDFAARRTWEIAGDVVALVFLVAGLSVALTLHAAISSLTEIGAAVGESGESFSQSMSDIGSSLSGVFVIGPTIGAPFDAASGAGDTLAEAGAQWQSGVESLADLVGFTIGGLVLLVVVTGRVLPRMLVARRRGALAAPPTAASLDLLAFQALARRPAHAIGQAVPDAATAWRQGDPTAIRALAALELKASGVRLRESP